MDTFYTILIWLGSGFAFAVGVCLGAALMALSWRDRIKADKITGDVNELLRERNQIGIRQARALEMIAENIQDSIGQPVTKEERLRCPHCGSEVIPGTV